MTALRARRSWTLLASACLAIAFVAPAAAERSSEPLSDPIVGTLIGEAIGDPADSGGDAAEPARTPRPLTLGKSAGEDPGMSVVDPSLYDLVPNYFYVTHVRDLRIGATEFQYCLLQMATGGACYLAARDVAAGQRHRLDATVGNQPLRLRAAY